VLRVVCALFFMQVVSRRRFPTLGGPRADDDSAGPGAAGGGGGGGGGGSVDGTERTDDEGVLVMPMPLRAALNRGVPTHKPTAATSAPSSSSSVASGTGTGTGTSSPALPAAVGAAHGTPTSTAASAAATATATASALKKELWTDDLDTRWGEVRASPRLRSLPLLHTPHLNLSLSLSPPLSLLSLSSLSLSSVYRRSISCCGDPSTPRRTSRTPSPPPR